MNKYPLKKEKGKVAREKKGGVDDSYFCF